MAQCHKICLFLEHRVTFAMIYVKFNNHKRIISYHCGRDMVKWKSHLGKKTFANIFGVERRTHSNFPRSKRTLKHMCGAKIMARGSCVRELFKVFQLYTSQMYSAYHTIWRQCNAKYATSNTTIMLQWPTYIHTIHIRAYSHMILITFSDSN